MAWTNPRTWVALEKPTAATMNTHIRDNLNALYAGTDGSGWTSYTPTLTGGAAATLNCRYIKFGKLVTVEVDITFTGAVTTTLNMTLPTTPAAASGTTLGMVTFNDTSASDLRIGAARLSGTVVAFPIQSSATAWNNANATTPWTWASGDSLRGVISYREA